MVKVLQCLFQWKANSYPVIPDLLLSYTQTIIIDKKVSHVIGFLIVIEKEHAQEFSEWKNCESVPYTSAHYCYTHCRVGSFANSLTTWTFYPILKSDKLSKKLEIWKFTICFTIFIFKYALVYLQ